MRKILLILLGLSITACTVRKTEEPVYTEDLEAFEFDVPMSTEIQEKSTLISDAPITTNTPITFNGNKTYMAELAKQLRKIVANSGIQVKRLETSQILVIFPDEIAFGTNQTKLESQMEPLLAETAKVLKEYDSTKIQIIGYTDNIGTVAANKALSLRHANEISNFLRLNGVDLNRIVVDGLGPENPLTNNTTPAKRRKNRRVEMTLINMQ